MLNTQESYNAATAKLQSLIHAGTTGAMNVVNHVMSSQPQDAIVRGKDLSFTAEDGRIHVKDSRRSTDEGLHRNALGQMATTVDMPIKFVDSLTEERKPWANDLLAHNLETVFHQRHGGKRFLTRSLNSEVRGFLSDKYRRIDSRPVVEAFATAVQEKGAFPYQGYVTDTKIAIQAIMPKVYEPITGELVAYGLSLENSDFGNGALSLRSYLLRIWCTNLAITEETMRQVHLGRRLDDSVNYSQTTYTLDAKATVSALRDVVRLQLDAKSLDDRMDAVKASADKEVSPTQAREMLKKMLTKGEAEAVANAYNSMDTYNLPPGNNVWRLSNAISWIAGSTEDTERKLDLMRAAGSVLSSK